MKPFELLAQFINNVFFVGKWG